MSLHSAYKRCQSRDVSRHVTEYSFVFGAFQLVEVLYTPENGKWNGCANTLALIHFALPKLAFVWRRISIICVRADVIVDIKAKLPLLLTGQQPSGHGRSAKSHHRTYWPLHTLSEKSYCSLPVFRLTNLEACTRHTTPHLQLNSNMT